MSEFVVLADEVRIDGRFSVDRRRMSGDGVSSSSLEEVRKGVISFFKKNI